MTEVYQREYYTEAYRIILSLGTEYISKIPNKLLNSIKSMVLEDYDFEYNPRISFKEQGVKKEAVALLTALKLQYWSNPEEKLKLKNIIAQNAEKHEQEKREKYNYDNLFKNRKNKILEESSVKENTKEYTKQTNLQIYKENVIIKLINKIKEFFKDIFQRRR